MGRERLAPSESIHRRRVLAGERKKLPPDFLEQRVIDLIQAENRLKEIEALFDAGKPGESSAQDLTPNEMASLGIEQIWLSFILRRITQAERQSYLQRTLNFLEGEQPDVFQWLIGKNGEGSTPLARIRDRIMPSRQVGGYYTKEGRE